MKENEISFDIRGAAFKVYNLFGPGLLESIYEHALAYELVKMGHQVRTQVGIPVRYGEAPLELGFRLDIIVDELVIIEVKSVDQLMDIHHKQLLSYLKLTHKKLGILINFNTLDLPKSMIRIIN
jgi:GxxExxY protein